MFINRQTQIAARLLAVAGASVALSACGSSAQTTTAAGTPERPLVGKLTAETPSATTHEAAKGVDAKTPGYQGLLERQTKRPRSTFTPCNLVTPAQARAILGVPIQAPLEAPQGPTCIYRTRDGSAFVTVAVQTVDLARTRRQMRESQRVTVADRTAYCGVNGQPMLYAGLADGRVLAIGARCRVARQFASRAVHQLQG